VVIVEEVLVESVRVDIVKSVTVVVVDDFKASLFDISLPPQNEINNIKSEPNLCLIIKLSQIVCLLCVFLLFGYINLEAIF